MKLKVYSVFDRLIGEFGLPMYQHSDESATRDFENMLLTSGNHFINHPADYTLMLIGEFNTKTGLILECEPTPICRPTDFAYLLPDYIKRKEGVDESGE